MSATTTPPSSDALHAERRHGERQLTALDREWRALTDDPQDFQRRAQLASSIEQLRAHVAALPARMEAAVARERRIDELRDQDTAARTRAVAKWAEVSQALALGDQIKDYLRLCAAANTAATRLVEAGGTVTQPALTPRVQLRQSLDGLYRIVHLSTLLPGFLTHRSSEAAETAIQTGVPS